MPPEEATRPSGGAPPPPPRAGAHPDRIGSYRIVRVLGQGGMGLVYEAEQLEPFRRMVALKVIRHGMDTHEVLARFESARQALAVMDHPNIAKALDAGTTEDGLPYSVMELVAGVPLTEYCDTHQLDVRHRLGKPVPTIIDLRIAKAVERRPAWGCTGPRAGEIDGAMELLELLFSMPAGREATVAFLRVWPGFDPLRGNSRFEEVLGRFAER